MFFEQARQQAQNEYEQDGTNAAVGWLKLDKLAIPLLAAFK